MVMSNYAFVRHEGNDGDNGDSGVSGKHGTVYMHLLPFHLTLQLAIHFSEEAVSYLKMPLIASNPKPRVILGLMTFGYVHLHIDMVRH